MRQLNPKEALAQFIESTNEFVELLESIKVHEFTFKNGEKWSISEITEHVCISDKSACIALIKNNNVDENELQNGFQERITYLHANENIQLEAPEAAKPTGKFANTVDALTEFKKNRNRIVEFSKTSLPDEFATGFKHPRLGYLKRFEWLQFITWHSNHHSKQIHKILKNIPNP